MNIKKGGNQMSTRSYICLETESKQYVGVYCHHDGELEYNGVMLDEHYSDRQKVTELISLGDISHLARNVSPRPGVVHTFDNPSRGVTVFYGRDRGEKNVGPKDVSLEDLVAEIWITFIYVYTLDGVWKVVDTDENRHIVLRNLKEALNELDEEL